MAARADHLALGHVAGLHQVGQHLVGAGARGRQVDVRSVFGRRLEEASEDSALGKIEVLHLLAEIELRRRSDAERAATHVGAVQIELEDLALRQVGLEPERQIRLLDLALQRPLIRQEQVLRELLGDRGAALHNAAGPGVLLHGADGAEDIDAEMLEEAPVLRGDHRLHQIVGQVFNLHRVVLQHAALADDVAVAIEECDGEVRLVAPVLVDRVESRDGKGEDDQRPGDAKRIAFRCELEEDAPEPLRAEVAHEIAKPLVEFQDPEPGLVQRGVDPPVEPEELLAPLGARVATAEGIVHPGHLRRRSFAHPGRIGQSALARKPRGN